MILPHLAFQEKRWLGLIIVFLLLVSTLPYAVALLQQTPDQFFSGAVFDRADYSVYISAMHDGARGILVYRSKFTTESHEAAYFRLFYHWIGFIGGLFHLAPQITFHIARLFFGAWAMIAVYLLSASIFTTVDKRRFACGVIITGAGLGWLKILTGGLTSQLPIDFWIPEAFTLFSIFAFPHFAATTACFAFIITLYLGYIKTPSFDFLVVILLLGLFAQQVNPIAPFIIGVALFGINLSSWVSKCHIAWQEALSLSIIAISFVPQFIYQQSILRNDPIWAGYSAQNLTLSPPPLEYLWGFGLLLLLAFFGIVSMSHTTSPGLHASTLWVVTFFIAAYAPVVFQRRFLHGITIPLGLLATQGVFGFSLPWLEDKAPVIRRSALLAIFSLLTLSTVVLFLQLTIFAAHQPDSIFDPVQTVGAISWLNSRTKADDIVLCPERTAQIVAERTGLTVYLGHWIETFEFQRKVDELSRFYAGDMPATWLSETGLDWVIVEPSIEHFTPSEQLELVYDKDDIQIYRVK